MVIMSLSACGYITRHIAPHSNGLLHDESAQKTEQDWAKIAWNYFAQNTRAKTGVACVTNNSTMISMWTAADSIAAIITAHQMNVIDTTTLDKRLSDLLSFLATMPLFFGKIPNSLYNAETGEMIDYKQQPNETGCCL